MTSKKKNTTNQKISILAQAFLDNDKLTSSDICELLDTSSRTTVNTHINTLKDFGISIVSKKINRKSYYVFDKNDTKSINLLEHLAYQPISEDIMRKYTMIQTLQYGPIKKDKFKNYFVLLDQMDDIEIFQNRTPLDIRQTYFYRLLNEQLVNEDHDIYLDPIDDNYYLTGNNAPLLIPLDDNGFLDICDQLSSLSPGSPYYKQLQSVSRKVTLMNPAANKSTVTDDSYLVYGKQSSEYQKMTIALKKLKKINYKNKILNIEYKNRKGDIDTYSIATGFIVFSIEKDCLYLIGANLNESTSTDITPIILIVNNIVSIQESSMYNKFFNSPIFLKMYEEMFCVSTEEPIDVVIEFDNKFQIPRRINYLHMQRKHSTLVVDTEHNVLIYKDKIRGKGDLKEYLRQFGSSARIISPKWLNDELKESARRALDRYKEENND